jgi:phenylacetic acid degradation operon negative regulatory protein
MQERNTQAIQPNEPIEPVVVAGTGDRALSARSIIASTLLGTQPPRLPARLLVRAAELFGIAEGTTRVALSRMVAAGDLEADDGHYRLVGPVLLERQARQSASRRPASRRWSGRWHLAVVRAERRDAATRAALRDAGKRLRLAELREGVWLRPDNLDPDRLPAARAVLDAQCRTFLGDPDGDAGDDAELAASLWDLGSWATTAEGLRAGMAGLAGDLDAGDTAVLAPAFTLSAAVLRHLLADPLLPAALLPADWPGTALRRDYDRYDDAFKRAWRAWFHAQT